ncbi:MAG: methylated-DNA--[protein]-cysteine S-methyltransferase [Clostridiales bacterium]|nr:methylated-DNA--[protein]-cysteine S-methyltransferase [Clostridiales bacterium]
MMYGFIYKTILGKVLIVEDGQGIIKLDLMDDCHETNEDINIILKETNTIAEAYKQLNEYLDGKRTEFTVALNPQGTDFQKRVWDALRKIPYGETRTYKQIAEAVGSPKAYRAVGMANHYNPILCMIPCHRVIGSNGKLVGFANGLSVKEKLLTLESKTYQ